jgi:hypothetical protein
MKTENKFKNKNGDLSSYSLLCGYVQISVFLDKYVKLFMEHSHFHVMSGVGGELYSTWDTYEINELTIARKRFSELKKAIQK